MDESAMDWITFMQVVLHFVDRHSSVAEVVL